MGKIIEEIKRELSSLKSHILRIEMRHERLGREFEAMNKAKFGVARILQERRGDLYIVPIMEIRQTPDGTEIVIRGEDLEET